MSSSRPPSAAQQRQQLIHTLVHQLSREVSTATVLFHAALAERMGLSQGDHKALDLIYAAEQSGQLMTAGQLADATSLSTGSITSLVDRLAKAQLVRRVPDPHDRRKVVLQPTHAREEEGQALFAPIVAATSELAARYTTNELQVITDYLQRSVELTERETRRLRGISKDTPPAQT